MTSAPGVPLCDLPDSVPLARNELQDAGHARAPFGPGHSRARKSRELEKDSPVIAVTGHGVGCSVRLRCFAPGLCALGVGHAMRS